jgi:NitT/TauT family transport system substrate-binding protein
MKNKRFIVFFLILALGIVTVSGCQSGDKSSDITVKVAALNGPTGMGMVKMMEDAKDDSTYNYEFTTVGAPDELSGKIISGEIQIAALPTNMASVIYNKTDGQIQLVAINTLGVLYILEDG